MIAFIYQLLDWIRHSQPHFFVAFFIYVWLVWAIKMLGARRYAPAENDFTTTTSVVIPVYDEDPEVLRTVLGSIQANNPDEILVVVDGGDPAMVSIAREFTDLVWRIPKAGKRAALKTAIPRTKGEIVIIVDSDTVFRPDTISNLVKPFADPTVGGATTNQRIFDPDRTFCRHCSDWMEFLRFRISMPAQSSFGTVGCLPGRAIAVRREIVAETIDDLLYDTFLGIRCEIGDDRTLTNYTLIRGYRTVFQSTAMVYTDAPDEWGKFIRQQLRWARSSQRETLKNLRWLIRKPFLAFCFLTDILTPFLLVALVLMLAYHWVTGQVETLIVAGTPLELPIVLAAAAYVGAILSIGIRQIPRFRQYPQDMLLLPVFVLALTFILIPIRIAGFMTMGEQNWITRRSASEAEYSPEIRQDGSDTGAAPARSSTIQPGVWKRWALEGFTLMGGLILLVGAGRSSRVRRYVQGFLLLPVFILTFLFIALPVRLVGLLARRISGRGRSRTSLASSDSRGVASTKEPAPWAPVPAAIIAGQTVSARVWAVRGVTLVAGLLLLGSLFWFGVNFEQREDPYANYRDQIEQVTGR